MLPDPSWAVTTSVAGAPAVTEPVVRETASRATPAAVTSNGRLVAPASVPDAASSVYPVPVLSSVIPGKRATPDAAALVKVPPSWALPGLAPMLRVTLSVAVGTVLPSPSWIATCMTGEIATPATTVNGCTVKASFSFTPALTVKPPLTTLCSPVDDATRLHGPALFTLRSEKVATPATAVMVFVPESVAPGAQVPKSRVTAPVNDGRCCSARPARSRPRPG